MIKEISFLLPIDTCHNPLIIVPFLRTYIADINIKIKRKMQSKVLSLPTMVISDKIVIIYTNS